VPTALITGANRGIGLEHARGYAEKGWNVFACARNPASSEALTRLCERYPDRLQARALDVTDHDAVDLLAQALGGEVIDVLLNNAGTFGPEGFPDGMHYQGLEKMDYVIWRRILEVNLLAPFKIAVAFHQQLTRAERPLLVNMTSDLGSIAQNTQGHSYAYRTSKSGLNMITRGMAREWQSIICIAMAPGWCRTDMGGEVADVDPVESVDEQQKTFARLTLADSGQCLDRFGAVVPW
jgi:NAD(P)-dependent dehydrogenase (short-subunit alcohol dehydrogenase family)